MKIRVPSIPDEGLAVDFDQVTPWCAELLRSRLSSLYRPGQAVSGHVDLVKTLQNVSLSGEVRLTLHPACARCGAAFTHGVEVPLQRNLAPYFSGPRESLLSEEEEIELSAEDLEFSFYHDEEIDLTEIIGEEIDLALPMQFLCKEECKGLCPRCGINRNEASCSCQEEVEGSPFAVLKGLKLKS
ncbi:MAG: DUF177 domain-containing protein [bacterium]